MDSDYPYQKYLGTNYAPTVDEARDIQRVIDEVDQGIITLDAQIVEVKQQLDALQERRSTIHVFGEQHRALLSPARKITPDILECIFLACLPSDRNPCMSASEAPMLLTQICSSWRQVALSAPRLWAAIHIVLPSIYLDPYPSESEIVIQQVHVHRALKRREIAVSEWLGRSGICPLSISMYEVLPWIGENSEVNANTVIELQKQHLEFIVNTIFPYYQQWRELDISLADDTLDGFLGIDLKAECLEALKMLRLTRKTSIYRMETEQPKHHWKDAAALLPVHATAATFIDFPVRLSDFPLIPLYSWKGLTELDLALTNDQFGTAINIIHFSAEILRHCYSLVTLTLFIDFFESGGVTAIGLSADKIFLPQLSKLNIALPPSSEVLEFSKRLYLPSLAEMNIQISQFGHTQEETPKILRSLFSSGGLIHTLTLCAPFRWMSSYNDLIQLLKLTTGLNRLNVSSKGLSSKWAHPNIAHPLSHRYVQNIVTDDLLRALSPFGIADSDIICPTLEEIVCSPDLLTGITEHGLKEFLIARKQDQRVANIRRITLFINELKSEFVQGEDQITLEAGSAVFFKKLKPVSVSPFDGYRFDVKHIGPALSMVVHTEL